MVFIIKNFDFNFDSELQNLGTDLSDLSALNQFSIKFWYKNRISRQLYFSLNPFFLLLSRVDDRNKQNIAGMLDHVVRQCLRISAVTQRHQFCNTFQNKLQIIFIFHAYMQIFNECSLV